MAITSAARFFIKVFLPGRPKKRGDTVATKREPGHKASAGGSARFLSPAQARAANLLGEIDDGGILIGKTAEAKWRHEGDGGGWDPFVFHQRSGRVRLSGEGHITCFAPTGAGKTTGLVSPILLTYPGSIVVTDLKGELYERTHAYRRDQLGHEIHVIDPYGITGAPPEGINVLSFLRNQRFIQDCKTLARLIQPIDPRDNQRFFSQGAQQFIEGLIAFVRHDPALKPAERTLAQVYRYLNVDPIVFQEDILGRMTANKNAVVAAAARKIARMEERPRSDVLSTVDNALDFLKAPEIERALSGSCDLGMLKRRPMTVYLCLPDEGVRNDAPFVRLFIGSALAAIKRDRYIPQHRTLILCDEFQNMGRADQIVDDIALIRGYGANFILMVQDMGALEELYGRHRVASLLANSFASVFFSTSDLTTAEYVSRRLGKTSIEFESTQLRPPNKDEIFRKVDKVLSARERPLLTHDEVAALPEENMIVFTRNNRPLPCLRSRDFDDSELVERLPTHLQP